MSQAPAGAGNQARVRVRLTCTGVVQGVGFRPAVYRHAVALGLSGFVANSPEGAVIEVEGEHLQVEAFLATLPRALPPRARLDTVKREEVPLRGERGFAVAASVTGLRAQALVPPDLALCADCRQDMENPGDRRYRYPFTTCTNCGPRYSVTRALPYDRSRTAMACFPLCPECWKEYTDPADRRFHAEPVCCPACGPRLQLVARGGTVLAEGQTAVEGAQRLLAAGQIVAVKGLGGFQLACRADLQAAVRRLRRRKNRQAKPFALMVRDLSVAHRLVALGPDDQALLASPEGPILLAPKRPGAAVAPAVAPGLADLGVMLPTTPLHVELFRDAPYDALVMTSGNASDEPICRGNREALARLSRIADAFLLHDRDVVRRVDDSVARSHEHGPYLVRRSRGYVPVPLPLPEPAPEPVLAVGGFLQTTVTVAVGGEAFPSQHVGDLDSELSRQFLAEVVANLEGFLEVTPRLVAVDAHPDYPSRQFGERLAAQRGGEVLVLQHHLVHAAAVLGEHGVFPGDGEEVGAISLDGTGYGEDETAWGGELLLLRGDLRWRRVGHLQPLPLVGGEAAVREPWRVAVAALVAAGEGELAIRWFMAREPRTVQVLNLAQGRWPLGSGAGRVFEAAGAILGLGTVNRYEGELAAQLEAAATRWGKPVTPWPGTFVEGSVVRSEQLLAELARRRVAGVSRRLLAAEFHATFAEAVAEAAATAFAGVRLVACGGGCFVNRLLRTLLKARLESRGFSVKLPEKLPAGDGGLSYGQAALAAVALARGVRPQFQGGV